jgi:hypothetical protein
MSDMPPRVFVGTLALGRTRRARSRDLKRWRGAACRHRLTVVVRLWLSISRPSAALATGACVLVGPPCDACGTEVLSGAIRWYGAGVATDAPVIL